MTPQQIMLIQKSWRLLRVLDPQMVGDLFYSKLFLDHPEVRALFPVDMSDQHQKLIGKFNVLIARLDHLDDLLDEIRALGVRHAGYGVKTAHYAYVGAALLWTLERGLGNDWTADIQKSWVAFYETLCSVMIPDIPQNQPRKPKNQIR